MALSISPPQSILFIALALFAIVLFSVFRKGSSPRSRVIRVAAGAIAIGGLLVFLYRPSNITVNAHGITSNSGGTISIPWSEVTKTIYISNVQASQYRTTSKIGGVAFGDYRIGTFHTSGGSTARVIAQQGKTALLVEANGKLYEFSPNQLSEMTSEVAKHVPVSGWSPGRLSDQASPESSSPTP